ncbi:MAG: glycoside hydrolase family 5 protein [Clostridiales bacterium]|nr:glycoside hydrolase family 5 protein [Clostridiales bacterium]
MKSKAIASILSVLTACAILLCACSKNTAEPSTESTFNDTAVETTENTTISQTDESTSVSSTSITTTQQTTKAQNTNSTAPSGTPYSKHGALRVNGANLVDQSGNKYQLYGMSTHGIAWFPQYINYETFKTLRDEWNTNCIRVAMYTAEYNGYCTGGNKEQLKSLVKNAVSYATDLGMYIIIDWHILNDQNPNTYKEEAKNFFREMSSLYKNNQNVLYEICNEPNSSADWNSIKAYANEIIPIIRANSPNSVVIVGTPTWSQDIDKALASPLSFNNVMYSLHFYAATHTDWLRQRVENCLKAGLPVFISEFGICDASGNGANDINQANQWKTLIEKYNLSYINWNLANKQESSSALLPSTSSVAHWSDSQLSQSGKWAKACFLSETNQ